MFYNTVEIQDNLVVMTNPQNRLIVQGVLKASGVRAINIKTIQNWILGVIFKAYRFIKR